jgi:hypothetical protein
MQYTLPWLVKNLLKDGQVPGMTQTNLTSLVVLLGNNLTQLKQVKKMAPYKMADADHAIGDILKAVKFLKEANSLKNINVMELQWLMIALEDSVSVQPHQDPAFEEEKKDARGADSC